MDSELPGDTSVASNTSPLKSYAAKREPNLSHIHGCPKKKILRYTGSYRVMEITLTLEQLMSRLQCLMRLHWLDRFCHFEVPGRMHHILWSLARTWATGKSQLSFFRKPKFSSHFPECYSRGPGLDAIEVFPSCGWDKWRLNRTLILSYSLCNLC